MKKPHFIHIPKCAGTSIKQAFGLSTGHQTLISQVQAETPEFWKNKYVFSFVRNPFSRMASFYKFLADNKAHHAHKVSFNKWLYLTIVKNKEPYYYRSEYFKPCFDWLSIGDSIAVDYVGRVETIDTDISYIAKKLGRNVTLERLNKTSSRVKFTDESLEIITNTFQIDLQIWYPNLIQYVANKI